MAKKILLGGILGGLALFCWGGFSHMVLRLGEAGLRNMPRPVYDSMKTSTTQPGIYFFPESDMSSGAMKDEFKGGPVGILLYKPTGAGAPITGQLINEAILNIIQGLVAAFLLSLTTRLVRFPQRVGFVFGLGVLSAIATNIEYWIWYSFPANFTTAAVVDKLIGFMVVGLIVAAFVKPPVTGSMQVVSAKAA